MALVRGTVYHYLQPGARTPYVLVLTNNIWNRKMRHVGVLPVQSVPHGTRGALLHPVVPAAPPLQIDTVRPVLVAQTSLGAPIHVLAADHLARVEDGLARALGFVALCAPRPSVPASPAGPVDYPAWSNIYYFRRHAAPSGDAAVAPDQDKRYVIVSVDAQNQAQRTVIAVRTTSQMKYPTEGIAFPRIEDGTIRACCGDMTSLTAAGFDLRRTFAPQSLPLAQMVAIAEGIAETHGLTGAIARLPLSGEVA